MKFALLAAVLVATPALALDLDTVVKTLDGKPVLNTIVTGGKLENAPPLTLRDALIISTLSASADVSGKPPGLDEQMRMALLHEKIYNGKGDVAFSAEELVELKKQIAARQFNSEQFLSIIKLVDPSIGAKK